MKNILKGVICIIIVLICFFYYQNNVIVFSKRIYTSNKISKDLNGYKIVQIADLHNKKFGTENERLVEKIKALKPDIIVITGDLVDSSHTDIKVAIDFIRNIKEIAPIYYITGNHEGALSKNKYEELLKGMMQYGVYLMDGKSMKLDENCYLLGIGDADIKESKEIKQYASDYSTKESELASKLSKNSLKILLAHEPQMLLEYARANVDMVLCGHAHGGQIRIPFTNIGFVAPDQGLLPKYTSGEYKKNATTMYVSRGLGNSILPLRIFNQPEIVEIVLEKQ